MQKNNFFQQVYEVVKTIPKGKVMTYGQIAKAIGSRDARKVAPHTALTSRRELRLRSRRASLRGRWAISPRIVGFALHANRSSDVPCHRVVNKDGGLAPGYAFGGPDEQKIRLMAEGVKFNVAGKVDSRYIMQI